MTEAVEAIEQDGETLDDLEQEWSASQAEAEAAANEPTAEEKRKAKEMAENMNDAFLWGVQNFMAPHVDLDQVINRKKGNQAFEPLAEKFGGEVPEWIKPFKPYFAAGVYMGMTIREARRYEAMAVEQLQQQAQQEAGQHGKEPGHAATE